MATKAIWEQGVKRVKGQELRLNGVMFLDANILPSDLENNMDDATMSKLGLNYSGKYPLDHWNEGQLIERMLRKSRELFKFLPVLLSLGNATVLDKPRPQVK